VRGEKTEMQPAALSIDARPAVSTVLARPPHAREHAQGVDRWTASLLGELPNSLLTPLSSSPCRLLGLCRTEPLRVTGYWARRKL
jgi:hypothetical protein